MAEKGKMRGGMDPAEMARRRWEHQRQKPKKQGLEEDSTDPRKVLEEIAANKRFPAYARTQAAKALAALPDEVEELTWRNSVQVRPDFVPPSWPEILAVARAAGAIE